MTRDAAIPLLGINATEIHKCMYQKAHTRMSIAALFIIMQTRNTQMSIISAMGKYGYSHRMEY